MSQQGIAREDYRVRVALPSRPISEWSTDGLEEALVSAKRAETQITALRLRVIDELTRRQGRSITEKTMRRDCHQSTRQTKREVETARKLRDLPQTSRALENGDISYRHAEIIARSAQQAPAISEKKLVERAKHQPDDIFAKTARREVLERSEDDGMGLLEKQRRNRNASVRTDISDGMTVLFARFDPVTGAQVRQVISQRVEQLWRSEDPNKRPSTGQRMADGLAELLLDSSDQEHNRNGSGSRNSTLLLIADYDTVKQQVHNLRLGDNTPLPIGALARLACDAKVVPAFFDRSGQPLWLGRSRRIASVAQRIALVARDRGAWAVAPTPPGARPPCDSLGRGRPHQLGKHVPGVQSMPPPHPRRTLDCAPKPQRQTHPPTPLTLMRDRLL